MKKAFTHPRIITTTIKPEPDVPKETLEEARLWATYTDNRDKILALHAECQKAGARSPRLVFIFCVTKCPWRRYGGAPKFVFPKRRIQWLRTAIRFTDNIVKNPDGKHPLDKAPASV